MDDFLFYSIESFPPLRESITKLSDLCNAEEIDTKAIERVIESDPMLYTDILHYANSPHFGFRTPLSQISQVIALFGLTTLRGMAIVAALKAHPFTDLRAYHISVEQWFEVMQKQQSFLSLWLGKNHRELLKPLGALPFILEMGRLVASYALMFSNNPYRFTKTSPHDLLLEEQNIISCSGDTLACTLFEIWNFDSVMIDSLRHSLDPENGIEKISCAAIQCARLLFTLYETKAFETIETILDQYGFNKDEALSAYQTICGEPS